MRQVFFHVTRKCEISAGVVVCRLNDSSKDFRKIFTLQVNFYTKDHHTALQCSLNQHGVLVELLMTTVRT